MDDEERGRAQGSVELVAGDPAVIRVSGALDLVLAPELERLVARTPGERLVVDLTDVDFLASAGMSALVRAHRERQALRVVATGRVVLRPLEITRLVDELDVYPTVAEAVAGR
ncbi:STAS domain-containing protein [Actinokineospora bangkokensis]|nr:STAS domain-containing protein [Actinokineospora bangkokensis]